jgi:hypothetical protein
MIGDEPRIGIAADRRNPPTDDPIDHFGRLGAKDGKVSQADDFFHASAVDLGQDRVKRDQVPMDIGDQSDAHCGRP